MSRRTRSFFRLLPYQILAKHWLGPALWLIPGGIALWWAAPRLPLFNPQFRIIPLFISGIGLFLVFYTLLSRQAGIRLRSNHFVIQTPFYPISFSYTRVALIRPVAFNTLFPPEKEKRARWRMYQHMWGNTVICVDLKAFPLPRWWLRLWLHPYMLHTENKTLILPVEDWMGLSRQMEDRRAQWRDSRKQHR